MTSSRKYAGLPDLDLAPDIYETPSLVSDASTQNTSTAPRTSEPPSPTDSNPNIQRSPLDPDAARSHFLPSRISARDADFSDSLDSRRQAYRVSHRHRRSRRDDAPEEDLYGRSSSEDEDSAKRPEALRRKIARLQRECVELKGEVERREEGAEAEEGYVGNEALEQLSAAMSALRGVKGVATESAGKILAAQIDQPTQYPSLEPEKESGNKSTQDSTEVPRPAPAAAIIASLANRLTTLESTLGINSLPLPTTSNPPPQPLLPALDALNRQLNFLNTTTPTSLDALSARIRAATRDAESLTEKRHAATKAAEEARAAGATDDARHPFTTSGGDDANSPASLDPELRRKIAALYGTLPTIESLAPLLPDVLERLRSLRNVHADAAGARERLDEVERNGREMEVEVGKWREALRVVEGRTREVEETVGENVGVVERWVGELEARVRGLGEGG